MKKLLFLFVLATTINVSAQESVLLRVNYTKGDVFLVEQNISQKMGAVGGMDMKIEMGMNVTAKEGEVITTESKIKSVSMNSVQGGQIMSYDSTIKEADLDEMGKMMKQQFDPMMKTLIISKLSLQGVILEIKVEPSTPSMEQFTKQAKGVSFPKEKVSVGSSWTDETNEQGMKINSTYTVSKIEDGKVYIDVTGSISGVGKGDLKGNLKVDIKTGIQDLANIDMTLNTNAMEMIISTKSTTTKM